MFCVIFIIFGFGSLGRLAFGNYVKSYSTFRDTLFTLLFFILGEPDFNVVIGADLFIGRMFFLLFMVISQYFVLFMFIAILRDAFSIARLLQYKHEKAVVKHMVNTILLYFNFFSQQSDSQLKVPV
ncbi:polycystin-2 [Plakobranchus ocellatus]|uniref:Polycystin-2 n=1 Tax=Plakobranchus ocellatus TaxID=259542 RepID=A0AAV4ADA0_9GAST|nr:polycystin-2 [Plakobranchus ocellatus]